MNLKKIYHKFLVVCTVVCLLFLFFVKNNFVNSCSNSYGGNLYMNSYYNSCVYHYESSYISASSIRYIGGAIGTVY